MSLFRLVRTIITSCAAVLAVTACAPVAQTVTQRFVWPSPPDEPKIEWIANYTSSRDLKGEAGLMEKIVGEEEAVWFENPFGIAGNGSGKVVVSLSGFGMAYLIDLDKKEVNIFGGEALAGAFRRITGVAVDGEGNFYAADGATGKIYVVSPENKPIRVLDVSTQVSAIIFFAIDTANKRLIIPDAKAHKVVVTDMGGAPLFAFGSFGSGNGKFNRPSAAAVERDGTIVVADAFNARIQRFTPKGEYLSQFGRRGDGKADFSLIKSVAVDSEDHIYVTDGANGRLLIFNNKGEALLSLGQAQSRFMTGKRMIGSFLIPQGIAIDKNDRIYIADQKNDQIQMYQYLNAHYLGEHPISQPQNQVVK